MNEFLETIFEIVKAAQQWDRFAQRGQHFHLKIENEPYMPLVIEAWDSPIPGEGRRISVAHYFESNGDLVPDPEIEITDTGWPIELSQAVLHTQVSVYSDDGRTRRFKPRVKREVLSFIDGIWARNLRAQGFIAAAQKMAVPL